MSITDRDIRRLERAAVQRQAAADLLLEHGFNLDAIYLGGYVVELALKALILRRTPRTRRDLIWEALTAVGAKGHDYEYLRHLLKQTACSVPADIVDSLRMVAVWSTDLRYAVSLVPTKDAERFLEAARAIRRWAERN